MKNSISIRKLNLNDSNDLWSWRNDEITRINSIKTSEILLEDHNKWLKNSLIDNSKFLYIGYGNDYKEKIGVCIFDENIDKPSFTVSINLNPKMRGLGLSHQLLASAISKFQLDHKHDFNLLAIIRKNNLASIKCFTKCFFILNDEDGEYLYYYLPMSDIRKYFK
jgi:hypothetical protein